MKSFILTIPKSLSQIENHYFCKCGNQFKNQDKCPRCGNSNFFTYEDVKNYNPKLYEIQNNKNGPEIFIEYPVFVEDSIKIKKERVAILIDKSIKLNKELREHIELYYDEICEIVKMYLKYLGLWNERKRYFYLLKKYEDRRVLILIEVTDVEVLLWHTFSITNTKEELFEALLKNSPKSVKRAVYEKYKKQVFKLRYEPLVDYIILNSVDDVNLQRELLKYFENKYIIIDGTPYAFIEILKHFDKKEVVRFLKKNANLIDLYVEIAFKNEIIEYKKSIEETFEMSNIINIVYEYNLPLVQKYKSLTFKLPKDSYELFSWSNKLRNCLSNYISLQNKRYLIFGVFKGNELTYAVNLDKKKKFIVEAKGFANSLVPDEDMEKIEGFVEGFTKFNEYL